MQIKKYQHTPGPITKTYNMNPDYWDELNDEYWKDAGWRLIPSSEFFKSNIDDKSRYDQNGELYMPGSNKRVLVDLNNLVVKRSQWEPYYQNKLALNEERKQAARHELNRTLPDVYVSNTGSTTVTDHFANQLFAPTANNVNSDKSFLWQADRQYELSKDKHDMDVKAADDYVHNLGMTQLDRTQMKNLGQLSGVVLGGAALAGGGVAAIPYLVPGTLGGNIIGSTAFGTALNEAIKYGTGKTMGEHAVNAARYLGIPQNEWVNYGIQMIGDMPVYMGAEPVAAAASRLMPTVKRAVANVVNPYTISGLIIRHPVLAAKTTYSLASDAIGDVNKYGLKAVVNNPEGWYRPYVDQVKNGYQGWQDALTAARMGTIDNPSKTYFLSLFKEGEHQLMTRYGDDLAYLRFDNNGNVVKWGVTQSPHRPNTYDYHFAGSPSEGKVLSRPDLIEIMRHQTNMPRHSYTGDTPSSNLGTTGQVEMNRIHNGESPTLWQAIDDSKQRTIMEDASNILEDGTAVRETPLSGDSFKILTKRPAKSSTWGLRYENGTMPYFNSLTMDAPTNLHLEQFLQLPLSKRLLLANEFIKGINPSARPAYIGLDGLLKIPIPSNFKL